MADSFAILVAPCSQDEAEAGADNSKPMTPLRVKQQVAATPYSVIRAQTGFVGPSAPPAELYDVSTAALSTNPTTLNYFDGYLWGVDGSNRINRSDDWGATWEVMNTPGLTPSFIHIAPCDDGELILVTSTKIHKSSGWVANPSTATWVQKASTTSANANFLPMGFDYSEDRTKFIATEYAALAYRADSRQGLISLDGGDTFTALYDTLTEHGSTFNNASHIHGCCYDPWLNDGAGGFWLSDAHNVGDSKDPALPAALYYSDENGENWTKQTGECGDPLPTTLTATEHGLVMGSDTIPSGVYILPRNSGVPIETADAYFAAEWIPEISQPSILGFAERSFRDPVTGIVYVGFGTNYVGDVAPVVMASDGITAGLVHRGALTDQAFFFFAAYGGRFAATVRKGDSSWRRLDALTQNVLKSQDVSYHDSGRILAGPQLVTNGQSSTASGLRATATGDFSVTIGEDSTCDNDDSIVLGTNLDSTADDQLQIGTRHIEITAVATEPSAPSSGKVRLYPYTEGGVVKIKARTSSGLQQIFPVANEPVEFDNLGTASSQPYAVKHCIDESGGGVPVFSDGANWRRFTDRAVATKFSGKILDLYTPYAAWAIEDIGPTSYSGPIAMVRRSGDLATQDIDGVGAAFQTEAETFTGAEDGFIRWIYDRSGGDRKIGQGASYALQPKIITAGVTNEVNGKTSITFLDQTLEAAFTLAQPYTLFLVVRANAYDATEAAGLNNIVDGNTPASMVVRRDSATVGTAFGGATLTTSYPIANSEHLLITLVADGTNSKIYKDGTVHAAGSFGTSSPGGIILGGQSGNTRLANMDFQCGILFNNRWGDADIGYINSYLIDLYGIS